MKAINLSIYLTLLFFMAGCGDKNAQTKTSPNLTILVLPTEAEILENKFSQDTKILVLPTDAEFEEALNSIREESKPEKFNKLVHDAKTGSAEAQFKLGNAYYFDNLPKSERSRIRPKAGFVPTGFSRFSKEALPWFEKSALQGNASAQFQLGRLYHKGDGVSQSATKAAEWYQKAAENGHVDAQFNLGVMYDEGDGVPQSAAKAAEWYQKAAEKDHSDAQFKLGLINDKGVGVPKNSVKATEWYQKAAEKDHPGAQHNLGISYSIGNGVPKNSAKAAEWYQKAAEHGHADAQFNLGVMYAIGEGVPKSLAKAAEWFKKAAEKGYTNAQLNLGIMYANGEGVAKNIVLAYIWSNLAASKGNKIAISNRNEYEHQLTRAQLAEGQRVASNWKVSETLTASGDYTSDPQSLPGTLTKQNTGTAFAISSNGHALTNHHVIKRCTKIKVAGREGDVKVITSDSVNDLALLQLPVKTSDYAYFNAEPSKLRQGEDIIVFGYPLNFVLSSGGNLTPGIISALSGIDNNTNQIQITAPIQTGSSGSPIMDKKGSVVGVVSMKLDDIKMVKVTGQVGQNVNFGINGQTVKSFLDTNQVPYKSGGGLFSREKSNADIAEDARKWTILLECWK